MTSLRPPAWFTDCFRQQSMAPFVSMQSVAIHHRYRTYRHTCMQLCQGVSCILYFVFVPLDVRHHDSLVPP
jgi:hypothetical protein